MNSSANEKIVQTNDKKHEIKATDPHIPQYNFQGYPSMEKEFDSSPRILDDSWQKFKKLS
jgi:hypothetical protein